FLARGHIPDHGAAVRARSDPGPIGAESDDSEGGGNAALAPENPLFLSRGCVPEDQRAVPIPNRRDAAAIRAKSHNIDATLMPTQDEPGIVVWATEVPPLPAAMLGGGVVQGPPGRTHVVQLQRTGGGGDIGSIAPPPLRFLLLLGVHAGFVGGSSLTRLFLP